MVDSDESPYQGQMNLPRLHGVIAKAAKVKGIKLESVVLTVLIEVNAVVLIVLVEVNRAPPIPSIIFFFPAQINRCITEQRFHYSSFIHHL
jgi:hypothetical protein